MKIAPSFPKIITVGAFGTEHLFQGPVEVTEKVDDRPSVIRAWKALGLNVVDVGNGVEF